MTNVNFSQMTDSEIVEHFVAEMHSALFGMDCDAEVARQHEADVQAQNQRWEDQADWQASIS